MIAGLVKGVLLPLVRGYIAKLATEEFAHWLLMEIAEALVKNTKMKYDNKFFNKFKEVVEK